MTPLRASTYDDIEGVGREGHVLAFFRSTAIFVDTSGVPRVVQLEDLIVRVDDPELRVVQSFDAVHPPEASALAGTVAETEAALVRQRSYLSETRRLGEELSRAAERESLLTRVVRLLSEDSR